MQVEVLKMVKQIATNFSKHKTVFHKIFFYFFTFYFSGIWHISKKRTFDEDERVALHKMKKTFIETSWTEGLEMFNMGGFS